MPISWRGALTPDASSVYPLVTMVRRGQITLGMALRARKRIGPAVKGTVARVTAIREEGWRHAWGFTVQWQNSRIKNPHSLFFEVTALEWFDVVADGPVNGERSEAPFTYSQLILPFHQWHSYHGTHIVGDFETW